MLCNVWESTLCIAKMDSCQRKSSNIQGLRGDFATLAAYASSAVLVPQTAIASCLTSGKYATIEQG